MALFCPVPGLFTPRLHARPRLIENGRSGYRPFVTTPRVGADGIDGFFSFWDEHVRRALA
jgi:hypothetical protein